MSVNPQSKKNASKILKMSPNANERGHTNEGGQAELYQLAAMIFGFTAFMFRYKWGAWISLMFYLLSIANARQENKYQQMFTSIGVVIVSFVSVYLQNPYPVARPEASTNIVKD